MALSKCAFFCFSNQIMYLLFLFCSLNSRTAGQRTTPGFMNSRTTEQQDNRTTEQQNNRTTEQQSGSCGAVLLPEARRTTERFLWFFCVSEDFLCLKNPCVSEQQNKKKKQRTTERFFLSKQESERNKRAVLVVLFFFQKQEEQQSGSWGSSRSEHQSGSPQKKKSHYNKFFGFFVPYLDRA